MLTATLERNDNVFLLLAPFSDGGKHDAAGRFGGVDGLRPHFSAAANVNNAAFNLNGWHFFNENNLHGNPSRWPVALDRLRGKQAEQIQHFKINLGLAA